MEPPRKRQHLDDSPVKNRDAGAKSVADAGAKSVALSAASKSATLNISKTAESSNATSTESSNSTEANGQLPAVTATDTDTASSTAPHSTVANTAASSNSEPDSISVASGSTAAAADFSQLELVKVLSTNDSNLSVAVEAKHSSVEGRVLVHMQKTPFDLKHLSSIISGSTQLTQMFHNDVYSKHTAMLPPELNTLQVTLIHPANDKHFRRYDRKSYSMVEETAELYRTATKPFIESDTPLSKQWIYNILSGESEADRVVYRDPDPVTGFVLLPDLKWTGLQTADLYCQALVFRRDLCSIRDLTGDCLPLLRNVRDRGTTAIAEKYGLEKDRLRIYFHYLPSFYHLHIHFSALNFDAPGTSTGKAHLLSDVISNLEQDTAYYSKATISFVVNDNHPHPLARDNRAAASAAGSGEEETERINKHTEDT